MIKVGDRVKFMNDVGGGIVTKVISKSLVHVENDDGFEIPTLVADLVVVNEEMDSFLGSCKRSVHEVGLLDLLDISRLTGNLPERRALVAIQPDVIDWGDKPTESVAAAIPEVVDKVLDLMGQWECHRAL